MERELELLERHLQTLDSDRLILAMLSPSPLLPCGMKFAPFQRLSRRSGLSPGSLSATRFPALVARPCPRSYGTVRNRGCPLPRKAPRLPAGVGPDYRLCQPNPTSTPAKPGTSPNASTWSKTTPLPGPQKKFKDELQGSMTLFEVG